MFANLEGIWTIHTSKLHEDALIIAITSTFGNGDPPANGEVINQLYQLYNILISLVNTQNHYLRYSIFQEIL